MTAATSAAAQSALLASAQAGRRAPKRVLPGFGLTLGYTLFYLSIIVLIPLSALVFKTFTLTWDEFWFAISAPRVLASYRLTFGASLIAALVNVVFGLLIAWVLVRYEFPGKKVVDALVDLPFALPTAVAGISLTALLTGFAMAFARAVGEYGSVIFIAGNVPMISEITPLIIIGKLEQYDYAGATAVAVVMLIISFVLLLLINALQGWQRQRAGAQS